MVVPGTPLQMRVTTYLTIKTGTSIILCQYTGFSTGSVDFFVARVLNTCIGTIYGGCIAAVRGCHSVRGWLMYAGESQVHS